VPWSDSRPLNPSTTTSWEDWYLNHAPPSSPRIAQFIRNLELLHKTKDEVGFDRLQRASLDGEDDMGSFDQDEEDEDRSNVIDDDDDDDEHMKVDTDNSATNLHDSESPSFETIASAALDMDCGFYVQEALDAGCDYKYFDNSPDQQSGRGPDGIPDEEEEPSVFLSHLSPGRVESILEQVAKKSDRKTQQRDEAEPHVYLSWGTRLDTEIQAMVTEFSLNEEQAQAFAIVARQSCWRHQIAANTSVTDCEPQLLMGLFGEGETGKSRAINAIRKWFKVRTQRDVG